MFVERFEYREFQQSYAIYRILNIPTSVQFTLN